MEFKLMCGFVMSAVTFLLCLSKKTAPLGFLAMIATIIMFLLSVPDVAYA